VASPGLKAMLLSGVEEEGRSVGEERNFVLVRNWKFCEAWKLVHADRAVRTTKHCVLRIIAVEKGFCRNLCRLDKVEFCAFLLGRFDETMAKPSFDAAVDTDKFVLSLVL